jgi:hypothetical protein
MQRRAIQFDDCCKRRMSFTSHKHAFRSLTGRDSEPIDRPYRESYKPPCDSQRLNMYRATLAYYNSLQWRLEDIPSRSQTDFSGAEIGWYSNTRYEGCEDMPLIIRHPEYRLILTLNVPTIVQLGNLRCMRR